jgi:energy-coupling factor transport system ATP-binding protein
MEIIIDNLTHVYGQGTPFERQALFPIQLRIPSGSFTAVIGQTGSGKSTLIQHLNGLLRPTTGEVRVGDLRVTAKRNKNLHELRKKVGLVFQYPEYQLFEETVEKDIAYGPSNFGFPPELVAIRVKEAMDFVGLNYSEFKDKSPFALSGGQMRRVAIAGVIAFQPSVLVLDEPTAGLDPRGKREILERIYRLHKEEQLTTLLVTHQMEDAARYADHIIVMKEGKVVLAGPPAEVFQESEQIHQLGLELPEITQFILSLNQKLDVPLPLDLFSIEALEEALLQRWKGGNR